MRDWDIDVKGMLNIDTKALDVKQIVKAIEKESYNIMAEHSKNYDAGKAPDGSPQKKNSPGYAAKKSLEGIKVGSQKFRGSKPTILTGDMKNSRTVAKRGTTIELRYEGSGRANVSNPEKASYLVKKGYKLNYLSAKNIDSILESVGNELEQLLKKAITAK